MSELFDSGMDASAFELPGDDAALGRVQQAAPQDEQAAASAEAESAPAEASSSRPRDERGRFTTAATEEPGPQAETVTAAETPAEPQAEQVDQPADTVTQESVDRVLEKFGIDPAAATDAELKMARSIREAEVFNGRLTSEVGDLRAAFEQPSFDDYEEPVYDPAAAAEHPTAVATKAALAAGDAAQLEVAYAAWAADDPLNAGAWLGLEQAKQMNFATQVEYEAKLREFQEQHQNAIREVAVATAQAAQAAREEAFVASTTTNSTGAKPSAADQIWAEMEALQAPYRDGWHINS